MGQSAEATIVALAPESRWARSQLQELLAGDRWQERRDAVLIAVHEALANADLHGEGVREATATVTDDVLMVEVADNGSGYDPTAYIAAEPDPLAERGRGLWLMSRIAERLQFRSEPSGSRVVLRFSTGYTPPTADLRSTAPPPVPSLAEANARMLDSLGAAVAVIDEALVVREASGPYTELFGLSPEALIGRDVRGVIADMKLRFSDPSGFEDRVLSDYAGHTDVTEHVLVLDNGRLIRRHSAALRREGGSPAGWVVAYLPVAEQTQLVATMQQSLLPPAPDWPGIDAGALYHPAQEGAFVGGDFFDFLELSSGNRLVLVGDVSGRGTAAAASSMRVRAYLRAALSAHGVAAAVSDLETTLRQEFSDEEFVTLTMCVEESQAMWTVTNCGHVPALLLRDGQVCEFAVQGPLLGFGVGEEWPREAFLLKPGDVLLLYTDGIVDAGRGRQRFGQERLHEALRDLGDLAACELVAAIDERVHAFAANSIHDDHVLLAVKRR